MKYQSIYNRLRRIEGQIRGVEEMIAKERSPKDILIQLEAIRSATSGTVKALIETVLAPTNDGQITLSREHIDAILRAIK